MAKKTYLRTGHKEKIVRQLLDRKFNPLTEANNKAVADVARSILHAQLTTEEWALIGTLPPYWVPRISKVRLHDEDAGYKTSYDEVDIGGSEAVPALLMGKTLGAAEAGPELWARYRELQREEAELKAQRNQLSREATALINSFRTIEEACEKWPEAAPVIIEVAGQPMPTTLPALTTLNAALDLPPEAGS